MSIARRGLLIGLAGVIAAPAIVRFTSLMPVKAWVEPAVDVLPHPWLVYPDTAYRALLRARQSAETRFERAIVNGNEFELRKAARDMRLANGGLVVLRDAIEALPPGDPRGVWPPIEHTWPPVQYSNSL